MGARRIFGGGEPEYVEPETHPITAEPTEIVFTSADYGHGDVTKTITVTSPTAWRQTAGYDTETVTVSPGSGPAGVTEVTMTIATNEGVDGTLVFEDGDGDTAEVYVDNHYGE